MLTIQCWLIIHNRYTVKIQSSVPFGLTDIKRCVHFERKQVLFGISVRSFHPENFAFRGVPWMQLCTVWMESGVPIKFLCSFCWCCPLDLFHLDRGNICRIRDHLILLAARILSVVLRFWQKGDVSQRIANNSSQKRRRSFLLGHSEFATHKTRASTCRMTHVEKAQ